ncbi:MAG: hypothetical protein A2174_02095 [Candidatus Portnoybacteria bacterium RBG_13_41_18]|uniref:Uncharacterized protein n=1 Tax=Candidatus Portnoybacteria bacterium RBG_13_41_18 TaxID=1801991 RepID=A0A1G2F6T8_9BACT|nr:MAG: hypothetical protein A2174_02095 [Candidatus Portnoybacteria bacterium RBG_13_41_18]
MRGVPALRATKQSRLIATVRGIARLAEAPAKRAALTLNYKGSLAMTTLEEKSHNTQKRSAKCRAFLIEQSFRTKPPHHEPTLISRE